MKPRAEQRGCSFDLQRHYVSELPTPGPIGGNGLDAIPTRSLSSCLNSGLIDLPPNLIRLPRDFQDPAGSHDGEAKHPPSPPSFEEPFHFALFPSRAGCWWPLAGTMETMGHMEKPRHGQAGAEVTPARSGMRLLSEDEDGLRRGSSCSL